MVKEYERVVVFRLGRLLPGGMALSVREALTRSMQKADKWIQPLARCPYCIPQCLIPELPDRRLVKPGRVGVWAQDHSRPSKAQRADRDLSRLVKSVNQEKLIYSCLESWSSGSALIGQPITAKGIWIVYSSIS